VWVWSRPSQQPAGSSEGSFGYSAVRPLFGATDPGRQGDKMGRIVQTWELIGDSFAILKSDKELMLLPIFSGIVG
jgi:hypothetical protein